MWSDNCHHHPLSLLFFPVASFLLLFAKGKHSPWTNRKKSIDDKNPNKKFWLVFNYSFIHSFIHPLRNWSLSSSSNLFSSSHLLLSILFVCRFSIHPSTREVIIILKPFLLFFPIASFLCGFLADLGSSSSLLLLFSKSSSSSSSYFFPQRFLLSSCGVFFLPPSFWVLFCKFCGSLYFFSFFLSPLWGFLFVSGRLD